MGFLSTLSALSQRALSWGRWWRSEGLKTREAEIGRSENVKILRSASRAALVFPPPPPPAALLPCRALRRSCIFPQAGLDGVADSSPFRACHQRSVIGCQSSVKLVHPPPFPVMSPASFSLLHPRSDRQAETEVCALLERAAPGESPWKHSQDFQPQHANNQNGRRSKQSQVAAVQSATDCMHGLG